MVQANEFIAGKKTKSTIGEVSKNKCKKQNDKKTMNNEKEKNKE
jgi:hypothetical protein